VLTWSEETYRILGLDPETFHPTHESFMERVHPEDRGRIIADLERALKTKEPVSHHVRMIRADGEVRTLYSQGRVVSRENGNPVRMFGYTQDVTAQRLADERLKSSNEKLRALSESLQSARDEEGARIARELHDELGSALTTLKWELDALEPLLVQEDLSKTQSLGLRIESMKRLADATINTVRRIASELRPNVLDELGFMEAIKLHAQQFQARTGIVCECNGFSGILPLSREQSMAVFRIFQEALTNVLRHARADRVQITAQHADGFVLTIRDNGRGITEEEKTSTWSLGVLGMRERAQAVGGSIDIVAASGQGTAVTVRIQGSGPQ
jgi:two-component system sensor histidine kinase UhpB